MHPYIGIAIKAVRQASQVILRESRDRNQIETRQKQDGTLFVQTASTAEHCMATTVQNMYPDHSIHGEENGWLRQKHGTTTWYIDSIDGTDNFIHGLPGYAICLAVVEKGIVSHSVVYDPNLNEMFTASRGVGAFLNDRRIRVSKKNQLNQSLISFCCPHTLTPSSSPTERLAMMEKLLEKSFALYCAGFSPALSLCYVAAGRLDGVCGIDLKIWDIAAGTLVVTESGGICSGLGDTENYLESGCLIAATPKLVTPLLKLLTPNKQPVE